MLKKTKIALSISLFIMSPQFVFADNYFNPSFLQGDPSAVADLSRFEKNNGQVAGVYRVDVYVNGKFHAQQSVHFRNDQNNDGRTGTNNTGLTAVWTKKEILDLGVKTDAFVGLKQASNTDDFDLSKIIPEAQTSLDFEHLRLDISVPQAAMNNDARGYIPPSQWDQGINALMLNYNLSGNQDHEDSGNSSSTFLSLGSGLNLGAWRLRDNSSWNSSHSSSGETYNEWEHISTYVERNIAFLKGELTAGDTSTDGQVFDSFSMRGAKIESDDQMLPDSQRGFAPTIKGIARSNAKVVIRQNGYILYQTYVSPGAFEINDLFPTSNSGDLQVSIEESDGSKQSFDVPYSAVPLLQREGRIKYAFAGGAYSNGNSDQQDSPHFGQGTLFWGLPGGVTVYGGLQMADKYKAEAIGAGLNLGDFGAISADLTHADSTLADDSEHHGESLRFLYAKTLNTFGTDFQLMGYRYSTEGYYSLSDTTYKRMSGYNSPVDENDDDDDDEPHYEDYYNLYYAKKGKMQLSLNQQLGSYGSVYASGSEQSYWHTDEKDSQLQFGYNGNLIGISYNLSYSYNKVMSQPDADQIFALNFSVPLSKWLTPSTGDYTSHAPGNDASLNFNTSTDNDGRTTETAGISGTLLERRNLNYNVQQGYANQGQGGTGSASLNYQGTYNNLNVGYNYSNDSRQVNYGMSGGILLHRNGITFSQPLGDTNILVAAPGADNVTVENKTGVTTDWRGYAVIPYASTYRENRVALDQRSMNNHTDLDNAVVDVVPTKGALVRAKFEPHIGLRAMLTLTRDGKPLPFGTMVSLIDASGTGIVADNGQVFLSGIPLTGSLKAQWGKAASQQCTSKFTMPEDSMKTPLIYAKLSCQ